MYGPLLRDLQFTMMKFGAFHPTSQSEADSVKMNVMDGAGEWNLWDFKTLKIGVPLNRSSAIANVPDHVDFFRRATFDISTHQHLNPYTPILSMRAIARSSPHDASVINARLQAFQYPPTEATNAVSGDEFVCYDSDADDIDADYQNDDELAVTTRIASLAYVQPYQRPRTHFITRPIRKELVVQKGSEALRAVLKLASQYALPIDPDRVPLQNRERLRSRIGHLSSTQLLYADRSPLRWEQRIDRASRLWPSQASRLLACKEDLFNPVLSPNLISLAQLDDAVVLFDWPPNQVLQTRSGVALRFIVDNGFIRGDDGASKQILTELLQSESRGLPLVVWVAYFIGVREQDIVRTIVQFMQNFAVAVSEENLKNCILEMMQMANDRYAYEVIRAKQSPIVATAMTLKKRFCVGKSDNDRLPFDSAVMQHLKEEGKTAELEPILPVLEALSRFPFTGACLNVEMSVEDKKALHDERIFQLQVLGRQYDLVPVPDYIDTFAFSTDDESPPIGPAAAEYNLLLNGRSVGTMQPSQLTHYTFGEIQVIWSVSNGQAGNVVVVL
eukprot:TRINITY_DN3211_c0_g2_i2.p1 TRINITY_DN3211_c0_g2~~TRINITY_DN3211_c0_g2_i2.p1  ORF type:complete len:558 (-),score=88.51 TRINITY_DN3211_c0_g2_i2:689-2362(-)